MYNFDNLCRLCVKNSKTLISLLSTDKDNVKFIDKILLFIPDFLIPGDKMPLNICSLCRSNLNKAYNFREKCIQAHETLFTYFMDKNQEKSTEGNNENETIENESKEIENLDEQNMNEVHQVLKNEINEEYLENNTIWHLNIEDESNDLLNGCNDDVTTYLIKAESDYEIETLDSDFEDNNYTSIQSNDDSTLFYFTDPNNPEISIPYIINHKVRLYQCNACSKEFKTSKSLKKHVKRHIGREEYHCNMCATKFFTIKELKQHYTLHSNDRPFQCEVCDKSFKERYDLTLHLRIHNNERCFICEICGQKFIRSGQLKQHKARHSDIKAFSCSICGKKFKIKSVLKAHMDKHNGREFPCNVCNKIFYSSQVRYMHSRIHKGEKAFKCGVCDKAFLFKFKLRNHIKMHTGEKSYVCKFCGKRYAKLATLKIHLKLHADESEVTNQSEVV